MWWDFPFAVHGWHMGWGLVLFPLFFLLCMALMFMMCRRRFGFSMCCGREFVPGRRAADETTVLRNEVRVLREELAKK